MSFVVLRAGDHRYPRGSILMTRSVGGATISNNGLCLLPYDAIGKTKERRKEVTGLETSLKLGDMDVPGKVLTENSWHPQMFQQRTQEDYRKGKVALKEAIRLGDSPDKNPCE